MAAVREGGHEMTIQDRAAKVLQEIDAALALAEKATIVPKLADGLKTAIRTLLAIADIEIDENGKAEPAGIAASATICAICDEWEARQ